MFRRQVLKFRLGCVLSSITVVGTHMLLGTHTLRGEAMHQQWAIRDTCSFVFMHTWGFVFHRASQAHWHWVYSPCVWMGEVRWCSLEKKKSGGQGVLDGILVTWGELLSSFNPPLPRTSFPSSLMCPLPGAHAECSVRRVSTEHPLCVLTKAECPGDKRGRSGLRAHKARGRRGLEEEQGREGAVKGWGGLEGAICCGLNRPTQPPKL